MYRDAEQVLDLVHAIYQQPGSRQQWNRIMAGLQKLLALHNLTVVEVDVPTNLSRTLLYWDVQEKFVRLYDEHYSKKNPVIHGGYVPVGKGSVAIDHEMAPLDEIRETETFIDFFGAQGSYHFMGAVLDMSPEVGHVLSAQRTKKAGAFSREDKSKMEIVTPHLSNRIALEKRFERAGQAQGALDAVLETQRTACLLLDDGMRVAFANPLAEEILGAADGLSRSRDGRLLAARARCASDLRRAVEHARSICTGCGADDPGLVRIERPSGKAPYVLLVRPCALSGLWTGEPCGVLVIINDPEDTHANPAGALAQAFSLTAAEAEVAVLLLEGKPAAQIASIRGVSMPTVRSQIRGLLEKTHTTSQLELVSLIFRTLGSLLA